ncbi:MAG: tyrosine-type recombinase/integrase, partial [Rikenellaceae bacterium]
MSRIKGKITTADYLTIEEFNHLIDGLHNDREYIWELYCRLSFCTALRASDVLSLTWETILHKEYFDITEQKTKKSRRITFNKSVTKKIAQLYTLIGEPDIKGSPFLNLKTKKHYSLEHINRKLKQFKVIYRLPIKAFSTHTFRKTFGRYVYESNGKSAESLILLNSIFRHSSIDITKVYIGLRQAEIDKVFNSIKF